MQYIVYWQRACILRSETAKQLVLDLFYWQNLFILNYIFTTIHTVQHALENKIVRR